MARKLNPIDQLPVRKRALVEALAGGASRVTAAQAAGVSKQTAKKYQQEADVQKAYRYLVRKAIPARRLVALIKGGTEATTTEFDSRGRRVKVPDWKTRRPYIEIAAEHGGYHEKKDDSKAVAIAVTVSHIGSDVTRTLPFIEASTEADSSQ